MPEETFTSSSSDHKPAATPVIDQVSTGKASTDAEELGNTPKETFPRNAFEDSIISKELDVKWSDIAGLEAAKTELRTALLPLRFPQLFSGMRRATRGLLLYGPPGTGKTCLAKALATEAQYTIFSISGDDFSSKWMSRSAELMRQLFALARENKPTIIFIEKVDALCSKPDANRAKKEDTALLKAEFLLQMDSLSNVNTGILVVAATNSPWCHPTIRKRFQKRIHIPLPDEEARKTLLQMHLDHTATSLGDIDVVLGSLAKRTEGFSGSDIVSAIQDAIVMPAQRVRTAKYLRKDQDSEDVWYSPCSDSDPEAMEPKWNQVPAEQLKAPPLSVEDLYEAIRRKEPSVGEDQVQKYIEWTQEYGMEGA
ncbi:P-loop containing nucleoside triphosphate hydrolase protein [Mariannaea sp. PMI_226]|nr:P-loop containing nucleoside triphosphate hydrolase protein [Mariannaea sp. PMI_226]